MAVGTRMLQRRATAAEWNTSNYVLAAGELGVTTDTGIIKIGDGVNGWSELPNAFDSEYLPILGKASDSNLLDGMDSSLFAKTENVPSNEDLDAQVATINTSILAAIDTARLTIHNRVVNNANFTLAASDQGKLIIAINSSYTPDLTCTIPDNATLALPVGFVVTIASIDKGAVKLTPAGATFLRGNAMIYGGVSVIQLVKTATNDWLVLNRINSPNPAVRRYVTDATAMSDAGFTILPLAGVDTSFDTPSKAYDTLGDQWVSGTPDRLICRRDGYYDLIGRVHITGSNTGRIYCMIDVNGVYQNVGQSSQAGTSAPIGAGISAKLPLKVNDYVRLIGFQNTGTGRASSSSTNAPSFIQMEWSRPL